MTGILRAIGRRPDRLAVIGAALVLLAMYAVAGIAIYDSRQHAMAASERELRGTAHAMADQTSHVFDAAKNWQRNLVARIQAQGPSNGAEFQEIMGAGETREMLENEIGALPQIGAVALVDDRGKAFNVTPFWPILSNDLKGHTVFNMLQSDAWISTVLGGPERNRFRDTRFVLMARRVSAPNGSFIGIAAVSIRLWHFMGLFRAVALERDRSVALFQNNGALLMRHPDAEAPAGSAATYKKLFEKVLAGSNEGIGRGIGVFDHRDRLFAAHAIPDYDMVVVATAPIDSVLAEWRRSTALVAAILLLVTVLVAASVIAYVRRSRNSAAIHQGRLQKLEAALNHVSQGVSMFDSERRLVMSNQRYAEIFRFPPERAVPGTKLEEIIEGHIAGGTFVGDDPEAYRQKALAAAREGTAAANLISGGPVETGASPAGRWSRFQTPLNDGRTISVINYPTPDGGWVSVHEDITDYRNLQEERERGLELISMIVENIPMTLFVKDADSFRYLLLNRAAEELHKIPRDRAIGKDANELFPPEQAEKIMKEDREFLASGKKRLVSEHTRIMLGEEKTLRVTRVKIGRDGDATRYILGIVEDVVVNEKQKPAQQQPAQQRMSA